MLKRLRKAHPILFCVLAEVIFLASLFVTDLVFTIALVLFRTDFASIDTYLYSTLQELVGAMVAVLFLVRTDRAGLLRRRGSGFFNGLLVGMYPLVFIGYNAFGGCTALTSVTIPDSVTKVGPGAFKGCSALTLADLGAGISSWGSGVFNDCTSLSKVIVDGNNNYLLYYNGSLYNGDMSMLYQVLSGRNGDRYSMPDEVKEIDTYAFWNQQNIKNVKVSPNVT